MLNDDHTSDCCEAPYRLVQGKPYCSVCGKPCQLVADAPPKTLEVKVHETIKTTDHGPQQL